MFLHPAKESTHGSSQALLEVVDVGEVNGGTAPEDLNAGNLCNLMARRAVSETRNAPNRLNQVIPVSRVENLKVLELELTCL